MSSPERGPATGSASTPAASLDFGGRRIAVAEAADDQVDLVASVLEEAARWLESKGIPAWPQPFPIDWIRAGMAVGTCYIAWDGGMPVGTFTLQRVDPAFWGARSDETAGSARYLHRLAVRRSHRGLGRALVELAEELTRDSGATCLRLDCLASDPGIHAYYEAAGFEHRGEVDVIRGDDPWTASLYEKAL